MHFRMRKQPQWDGVYTPREHHQVWLNWFKISFATLGRHDRRPHRPKVVQPALWQSTKGYASAHTATYGHAGCPKAQGRPVTGPDRATWAHDPELHFATPGPHDPGTAPPQNRAASPLAKHQRQCQCTHHNLWPCEMPRIDPPPGLAALYGPTTPSYILRPQDPTNPGLHHPKIVQPVLWQSTKGNASAHTTTYGHAKCPGSTRHRARPRYMGPRRRATFCGSRAPRPRGYTAPRWCSQPCSKAPKAMRVHASQPMAMRNAHDRPATGRAALYGHTTPSYILRPQGPTTPALHRPKAV